MPTILPISDLRNYTEVLSQVDVNKPVYLTRNGRGRYVISKLDDYDPEITAEQLLAEIKKGDESLNGERHSQPPNATPTSRGTASPFFASS